MNNLYLKIISILLIFLGEGIVICAEVIAAKLHSLNSQSFLKLFSNAFLTIIIGGIFLILGYIFAFKSFKNIWIVTAVSFTAVLILEPSFDYFIFKQLPTKGALIGLCAGLVGFCFAVFYK